MAKRRDRHAQARVLSRADSPPNSHPRSSHAAPSGSKLEAAALLILLVVVAARPLIPDSHDSAQLGPALDLRDTYFLGPNAAPQSPRDGAFVQLLVSQPTAPKAVRVTVAAGAVLDAQAVTPPGVPGRAHWQTGPWNIRVSVLEPNDAIELSVGVRRIREADTPSEAVRFAAGQRLRKAGVYAFEFGPMGWSAGTVADRIQIIYRFSNRSDTSASATLEAGGAEGHLTTPGVYLPALPGPMLTVGFDTLILAALLLYGFAVARSGRWAWRRSGAEVGIAILLVAWVVSTAVAGNKRLAIVGAADFACLVLLALLLTQLLRRPWQVRLALCVIVATGTVAAVRCIEQVREFDETIAHYAQSEAESWAARGRNADDPTARLFRSRLLARDPTGYMAHPNIAGSYFLLTAFAAAGLAAAKFKAPRRTFRRLFACLSAAFALLLVVAMGFTSSRGAAVAGAGAIAVFVALRLARARLAPYRGRLLAAAWICILVGGLGIVGFGRATGSLPSDSLAFRWQYWSTSWPMIRDHLLGVGTGHFGQHYLHDKPVTSPDEVSNAHNLFVQAAAEWGVPGLAGLIALLVGVSIVLAHPSRTPEETHEKRTCPVLSGRVLPCAIGLTVAVIALFAASLYGTTGAYRMLACAIPTVVFPIAFVLAAIDSDRLDRFDDTPVPAAFWFLCAGLLAFCAHNVISFSLYVPTAATPFFALIAVALSLRHDAYDPPKRDLPRSMRIALPAGCAAVFAGFVFLAGLPVARSGWSLFQARTATHYGTLPDDPSLHRADRLFAASEAADPLDPVPASDWARWLAEYPYRSPSTAIAGLERADRLVRRAIGRDPHNAQRYRQLAGVRTTIFEWSTDPQHLRDAVAAAEKVVRLYVESPRDQLGLAQLYDRLFSVTNDEQDGKKALAAYRRALALDDERPDYEVRRFSPRVRNAAEERVRSLKKKVSG